MLHCPSWLRLRWDDPSNYRKLIGTELRGDRREEREPVLTKTMDRASESRTIDRIFKNCVARVRGRIGVRLGGLN